MLLTRIFTLVIILVYNLVYSQQFFNNPESAAFHSESSSYFVSNFSGGNIIEIDSSGMKSIFKEGISKPCGMVICDSILYVVENPKKVSGFKIDSGAPVLEIQINEALFLNDITFDDSGSLYVTDSGLKAVYQIDRVNKTYQLLVETLMDSPNGIIYDKFNNRLLVCYFREESRIDEINIKESTIKPLITPPYDNLDGITLDELGNCYISSFGPGSFNVGFKNQGTIIKYDNSFKEEPLAILTDLYGPADIYYNNGKKELVIPFFLENRIQFIDIE
ncbi:MAG: hypothetical protein PVH88_05625 [Ignavibacteria bacterium]